MNRRGFLKTGTGLVAAGIAPLVAARPLFGHHGWGWAEGEVTELTGRITAVRLGNPHGELTLDADGEAWVVEVGQPWRNERAGLTEAVLTVGRTITVHGNRSADPSERLVKAVRLVIDGRDHVLYPERVS